MPSTTPPLDDDEERMAMTRLHCTDRSCPSRRLLAAARADYTFFVRARVLDSSRPTWLAFLTGYLWMEGWRQKSRHRRG